MDQQNNLIECVIKPRKRGRPKLSFPDIQNKTKIEIQIVKIEHKKYIVEL